MRRTNFLTALFLLMSPHMINATVGELNAEMSDQEVDILIISNDEYEEMIDSIFDYEDTVDFMRTFKEND